MTKFHRTKCANFSMECFSFMLEMLNINDVEILQLFLPRISSIFFLLNSFIKRRHDWGHIFKKAPKIHCEHGVYSTWEIDIETKMMHGP